MGHEKHCLSQFKVSISGLPCWEYVQFIKGVNNGTLSHPSPQSSSNFEQNARQILIKGLSTKYLIVLSQTVKIIKSTPVVRHLDKYKIVEYCYK